MKLLGGGGMATRRGQVFECGICGNVVQVVEVGVGQMTCCGEPMKLVERIDTKFPEEADE